MVWVKVIIFYPMLWLRGLFLLASNILGGFFFIGGLISWIAGTDKWMILVGFGLSFTFFILRHFYDQILLKLNPTGQELYLFQ